jgi:hypothetical protein
MPKTDTYDREAAAVLGVPVSGVTLAELEYLKRRKGELESSENPEPLLVSQALGSEFNVKRIQSRQQAIYNAQPSSVAEVEFPQAELADLKARREEQMKLYNQAMEFLGARKKQTKDVQCDPLALCGQRYLKALAQREQRGEAIGEPSREAQELAAKTAAEKREGHTWNTDFKVKGVLPKDVRKRAADVLASGEKKNEEALGVMVHDFLHDPVLAMQCIFPEALPNDPILAPAQELRVFGLWLHPYGIYSCGYGTFKTGATAYVMGLRAVLMEDRTIGIVSYSFRQAQLYFEQYFDKWIETCPVFAAQVAISKKGGTYRVTHGDEAYAMHFKSRSIIKALPADLMKEGKAMESESWTDGGADEWTVWPNGKRALQVFETRMRQPIFGYDAKDPIFGHHHAFLGKAGHRHLDSFKKLETYASEVAKGGREHCLMDFNYLDFTPRWRRQEYGINESNMKNVASGLTQDEYDRIILGRWTNDTSGNCSITALEACCE